MTPQRELATKLLETVANDLEMTFRTSRASNTSLAQYAGDASQVLGLDVLTARFARLLPGSKGEQLTPIEKVNEVYPVFTDDFAMKTFTRYYPEMLPCLENGFDSLLDAATTELAIEEVALSQALLGWYDDALTTSKRLIETHRQNNVRFVVAIEQYRNQRVDDAIAMQETLVAGTLTGWGGAQFALGICNRVPWFPYPYPDY